MTHHQNSPMSITQLVHSSAEEEDIIIEDPDVKIAAEVLGDMARLSNETRRSVITLPPLSNPSTTPSSPLPTPTAACFNQDNRLSFSSEATMVDEDYQRSLTARQPNFINRVSNIPLVNSALRVYENSKNSSSVMKYGAEMVESLAAPIYDKFGKPALSNVDEWGCKQLDKLEEKYPSYVTPIRETKEDESEDDDAKSATFALSRASLLDSEGIRKRRDSRDDLHTHKSRSRNPSRSTSPHRPYGTPHYPYRHPRQQVSRSKWHQIVMHASSAAGTTAAVISEESMKCLKYCLSWLQYASQHIIQQLSLLRNFVSIKEQDAHTLATIKKEIVDTLRKVVDVISRYAGSGLPEQAKLSVRGFILALPTRWAMLNSSKTASPAQSPALKPIQEDVHETSIRLMNFGNESLEMINSVALVFSDTIDRAEIWLNRLRVVGVAGHRKPEHQNDEPMDLS
ncbi:transcription factor Opi1-domain-containing protein [Choanephora cucurbitarum]|nr:transcription factor Opi1-domain-containing protein [Choanephora cucurbitarum]